MQPATHKKILIGAFGCAAVFAVLAVVGLVLAPRLGLEQPADRRRTHTTQEVRDALAELRALELRMAVPPPAADTIALRPRGRRDGAAIVWAVWRDSTLPGVAFAFGETLPAGALARWAWIATAHLGAVDSLLLAARSPWAGLPPVDVRAGLGGGLASGRALYATRAMLARARVARDSGRAASADSLVRGVITIGRRLQREPLLSRVALGARVELEGLTSLPERVRWRAAGERAQQAWRAAEHLVELLHVAGSAGSSSDTLGAWARDRSLEAAVRAECIVAIGFGWLGNPNEMIYGPAAERTRALTALERLGLPEPFPRTVEAGLQALRLPVAARLALAMQR